ncbi:hypothetical protein DEU38_11444 [Rhodococcus sp. AG1013]|uniref:hypothetical protein n=1 Tax=Rhodococcus sp. AG1013 TaxID=2183996 RepID=UPI000E0CB3B6|nr:hypothetical protein [Rhodococcus sp. AG1013]RDI21776.1 hypothetical protein DEU38_11444 [Rhodococcus sp. AG1013]
MRRCFTTAPGFRYSFAVIAADYEGHRMAHPAPYLEMLAVTRAAAPSATHASVEAGDWDAVAVTSTEAQTRQFVTLYEALRAFDDTAPGAVPTVPRLCFAGAADEIAYGPGWGDVTVKVAEPLLKCRADLEARGWVVEVMPGRDHMSAMGADVVLPLLTGWLAGVRVDR